MFSKSQLAELDEVMSKIDIGTKVVFNIQRPDDVLSVSIRQRGFKSNQVYCVTEIEKCRGVQCRGVDSGIEYDDPVCRLCVGHVGLDGCKPFCLMPSNRHLPFFDIIADGDFITEKDMEI